ncbi:MAG TPA: glycosyltransferase family 10 [Vicinamibacterales bacterium]|nr:glycosyltransferase family 10 [Vicinamibacterales bacterium]
MLKLSDISVFVDPVTPHFLKNRLFDTGNVHNVDGAHAPYFYLKELFTSQGIDVNTADYLVEGKKRNKLNAYFSLGITTNYRRLARERDVILSAYFTMDAPIVMPSHFKGLRTASRDFKRIYSYSTPEALAPFGCRGLKFEKLHIPYCFDRVFPELWANENRKFLCLLNYNRLCRRTWRELYTARLEACEYFSRFNEIDMFGFAWDRLPYVVGESWIPATLRRVSRLVQERTPILNRHPYQKLIDRVWRGPAESKYVTQSQYTFTICYENMDLEGWLNENIFDCFLVGTIPIYLGAPDITDYVPENCFINRRRFKTYDDLRACLHALGPAEIRRYKENARDYLASARFAPFRKESFAQIFTRAVEEDAGVSLRHELPVAAA